MLRAEFLDIRLFVKDPQILKLFQAVDAAGGAVRFVGGAVRDALLGLEGSEIDLATNLSPEELLEACDDAGLKTVPIGLKTATTGVVINDKTYPVSSLWQQQRENDPTSEGYTDDWNADASRRDLTINAIYADEKGNVFDYYNGISDLEEGRIRFIGRPEERIRENPVRIMRFFRFYALFGKGEADAKSLQACYAEKNLLRDVAIEQIRDEFFKILSADFPVPTLRLMASEDLVSYILPVPTHLDLLDKLTALVAANRQQPDSLRRLFIIYLPNAELAENLATRLHLSKHQKKRLLAWARINLPLDEIQKTTCPERQIVKYGKDFCIDKLLFAAAQNQITAEEYTQLLKRIEAFEVPVFPLQGQDLIGLGVTDSTRIGAYLEQLKEFWFQNHFQPDRQTLLNRAKSLLASEPKRTD